MTITICIGSSCHLKGSRTIIQKLEELITQDHCLPPCSTAEIGNKGFVGKIIYKA